MYEIRYEGEITQVMTFFEKYQIACEKLRKECDLKVANGELTQDEANFRYHMVVDELLWD